MFKEQFNICIIKTKDVILCNWCDRQNNEWSRYIGEPMLKIDMRNDTVFLCLKHARELRTQLMEMNFADEEL